MLYLILTIIFSIGIFLIFRIAGSQQLNALPIVCVNYLVALITGYLLTPINFEVAHLHSLGFYVSAVIVGVMFMTLFLLVHKTINTSGLSITSAATKLSVVFPVAVSLIIDLNDKLSLQKVSGFMILLLAFGLILYRGTPKNLKINIVWPVMLFIGLGVVDSLIKMSQQFFIPENAVSNFTMFVFAIAAISGIVVLKIKNQFNKLFNGKTVALGILLGWFNYGSLYFMLKALHLNLRETTFLDGSRIFMVNSLGIILVSTLIGMLFYKEKLFLINYVGLLLSVIGFYLVL